MALKSQGILQRHQRPPTSPGISPLQTLVCAALRSLGGFLSLLQLMGTPDALGSLC
jgi:hypothetical protein